MPETLSEHYGGALGLTIDDIGLEVLDAIVEAHGDDGPFVCKKPNSYAKWIESSSLQKSVRRGNVSDVRLHCDKLLQIEPEYIFRRQHVVGIEDVGIGNLLALAAFAKGGGSKTVRAKFGGTNVVARALTKEFAVSPKDRIADELQFFDLREWGDSAEKYNQEVAEHSDKELLDLIANRGDPVVKRMMALMYYTRFERNEKNALVARAAPKMNWRHALRDVCAALESPPLITDICWVYSGRMMERQAYCLPMVWDLMKDQLFQTKDDDGIDDLKVDGYPAVAIDGHTSQGKKAIRTLIKRDPLCKQLVKDHVISSEHAFMCLHLLLFRAEGHMCRQRIDGPVSQKIRDDSTLAAVGMYTHSTEDAKAMLTHSAELVKRMNGIRMKQMG